MKCRICGNENLKEFLSLGKTPLANSFLSEKELDKALKELEAKEAALRADAAAAEKKLEERFSIREEQLKENLRRKTEETEKTLNARLEAERARITAEFSARAASAERERLKVLEEKAALEEAHAAKLLELESAADERIRQELGQHGLTPEECERDDTYYHLAYKAKLHRVVPEAAYAACFEVEDDEPLAGETHYRVRVEQRNGQRAWSSPVWVQPA